MNESLNNDLVNFRMTLEAASVDAADIEDCMEKMHRILTEKDTLGEAFQMVGNGAFKETYKLNDKFVIKFACVDNETEQEKYILEAAEEADVSQVFLPSWFCKLTSFFPNLLVLEENDSYKYRYDEYQHETVVDEDYINPTADYVIIQPFILHTVEENNDKFLPWKAAEYANNPIADAQGNTVDHKTAYQMGIDSQDWLQLVVDLYSVEFLKRLAKFFEDNDIRDLHNNNIGYYVNSEGVKLPVIFDWLSF